MRKKLKPSLSSIQAKNAWLYKNKGLWWDAEPEELNNPTSDLMVKLIEMSYVEGLYRRSTTKHDVWYYLTFKMASMKKVSRAELLRGTK